MSLENTRLGAENTELRKKNSQLGQEIRSQEPLFQNGVKNRRRFLEMAKKSWGVTPVLESVIEAGNAAAHRGDVAADSALLSLGLIRAEALEVPIGGETADIEKGYKELYSLPLREDRLRSLTVKRVDFLNLSTTMASCSKVEAEFWINSNDLLFRDFATLALDFAARSHAVSAQEAKFFEDNSSTTQEFVDLFELSPEVDDILEQMREIAAQVVARSKGKRRYRMGR